MQAEFVTQLTKALSSDRLSAYQARFNQSDYTSNLFSHYLWNMMLSESLYPTLQMLEITLRNTLHHAASEHYKNEWWFQNIEIIRFPNELQALAKAKATLQRQNKPITPGRLIAELNFGFWTSLMDKRYEHNQVLWPTLLKTAFPHMPKRIRKRQTLSKRFHKIRNLRNRIFHHEPIWYWQDLKQQHQQIIEAIGWIEPAAKDLVMAVDRFPAVYQTGLRDIEQKLQQFC